MNKFQKFFYNNIMIVGILFFSGAFIAGKFSVAEFPPVPLTFIRFSIAGTILFFILIFQKRQLTLPKKEIPKVLLMSLTGMVAYHLFFFSALKYTSSTNSAIINSTNPVVTSILAAIFFKEEFNKKTAIGILISFIGVLYLATNGSLEVLKTFSFNYGDMLMGAGVLCFAGYFMILKDVLKRVNPYTLTAYIFIFCALMLLPFILRKNALDFIGSTTIQGWGSVFYMAIFASVFGYLIQQISVQRIGLINTSLYININPVFSMILAYLILGEEITLKKVLATIIIIIGVVITIKSKDIKK